VPERVRKIAIVTIAIGLVWFAISVAWAVRPQTDSVPVGIDKSVEPAGKPLSVDVQCNGAFDATARDGGLPTLPAQPAGAPALEFQREPCELVHSDARLVLAINTVVLLLLLGGSTAVLTSRPRRVFGAQASA
jgi:hypothetical protein